MNIAAAPGRPSPFYQSKHVILYCGKAEEILPSLTAGTIDALITDPPYGNTDLAWDKSIDLSEFWPEAVRICKPNGPMVLFSSGKFTPELIVSNYKHFRYELIWEKNLPVGHLSARQRPLRSHETILVFSTLYRGSTYNPQMTVGKPHMIGNGKSPQHYAKTVDRRSPRKTNLYHPRSVLRFNNSRNGRSLHPTQKPLDLMEWLVRTYTNRGDLILDPYAGAGSTLLAAKNNGRMAVGIEQNKEYCDIIASRLESS